MSQGFSTPKANIAGNGMTQIFVNGTKQATTDSAQDYDFTVPAGVKRITVTMMGIVHVSGSTQVRLGDSSGVYSTGYTYSGAWNGSTYGHSAHTDGFDIFDGGNITTLATVILTLHDEATNTWACSMNGVYHTGGLYSMTGTGYRALTSELTTVQLWVQNSNATGGSVNIQYDNPDPTVVADSGHGIVVQQVHNVDGEVSSSSTTAPQDDTIMQNNEGYEMLSASITPTKATNLLRVDVTSMLYCGSAAWLNGGLFQDDVSSAFAQAEHYAATATGAVNFTITDWIVAGTTDSTTIKFRAGAHVGTIAQNGASRRAGGAMASLITITEYEA